MIYLVISKFTNGEEEINYVEESNLLNFVQRAEEYAIWVFYRPLTKYEHRVYHVMKAQQLVEELKKELKL